MDSLEGYVPTFDSFDLNTESVNLESVKGSEAVSPPAFDFPQLDIEWDAGAETLWAYMTPNDRPNYSPSMLRDSLRCMDAVRDRFGSGDALKYMVVGSRFPGVFNLGGDLEKFAHWAETGNRPALLEYGMLCVKLIHRVWSSNDMNMLNIALVEGDAFGGGLESMLCFDTVVAERQARFSFPEIKFGLFPGMGALSLLSRRIGTAEAERMVRSGRIYTAEEFLALGLISVLAETGEGRAAVREHIKSTTRKHAGHVGISKAARLAAPVSFEELSQIVEVWADCALQLDHADLRMMKKLASAQKRITKSGEALSGLPAVAQN